MSLPALRAIRERFPEARITVLAKTLGRGTLRRRTLHRSGAALTERRARATGRQNGNWRAGCAASISISPFCFPIRLKAPPSSAGGRRAHRRICPRRAQPAADRPCRRRAPARFRAHECFYYLELLRRAGLIDAHSRSDEDSAGWHCGSAAQRGEALFAARGGEPAGDRGQSRRGIRRRQTMAAGAVRGSGAARLARNAAARSPCSGRRREGRCAKRWRGSPAGLNFAGATHAARVHRYGRGLPRLSDQRFRRHAHRVRVGVPR